MQHKAAVFLREICLRLWNVGKKFKWQNLMVGLMVFAVPFAAKAIDLISTPDSAFPPVATGAGDSCIPIVSADGRYVLFASAANNLATQTNGAPYAWLRRGGMNIYLRDRISATTTLISTDPTGRMGANDHCVPTAISTNGQYALFESPSTNLTSEGKMRFSNIFLRDLVNQTTTLVSVGTNGSVANGACFDSAMTPDGRYVVFSSAASNLVSGDTNGITDVFVRDMQTGIVRLVSEGAQATSLAFFYNVHGSSSDSPAITPDGRYVVFMSTATNLLPNVSTPGEIYVRDLVHSQTLWVSTNAHQNLSGTIVCYDPKISDDGQIVTYEASALTGATSSSIFRHHLQSGMDDVSGGTGSAASSYSSANFLDASADGRFTAFVGRSNGYTVVLVWDAQASAISLASVNTNGLSPGSGFCDYPRIDATGRYVSFLSTARGLVTNAIDNGSQHIYWRDLQSGITKLMDVGTNGSATGRSFLEDYSVSSDGRLVAYDSPDADITTNDFNGSLDVFARNLATDTTELISPHDPALPGQTMGRTSRNVSISADGRYAAFCYTGPGIVADYTNKYRGVFVRDLLNQSNFLVSVDTNGLGGANNASTEPVISGNSRYVAFTTLANNLGRNLANGSSGIFIRDLQTGTTTIASPLAVSSSNPTISADGKSLLFFNGSNVVYSMQGLGSMLGSNATVAAMTPNGRYVAFCGTAYGALQSLYVWDSKTRFMVFTNSMKGISRLAISTNGQWIGALSNTTVRVFDRLNNTNRTLTTTAAYLRQGLHFSGDGRYFAYAMRPWPFLRSQVYIYDWQNDTNILVSRSYTNSQAALGNSDNPDISSDGRYVVYESDAASIVPADTNRYRDVFLYDQQSGMTTLLSASANGQGTANSESIAPAFIGDGMMIGFRSWASDLAENDSNGQESDLFALRIYSTNSVGGIANPPPAFSGELIYAGATAGQGPHLIWAANPGTAYQVQYKDNLADPDWLPVNGSVVVEGGVGSVIDLSPNPDHRFYRIVAF